MDSWCSVHRNVTVCPDTVSDINTFREMSRKQGKQRVYKFHQMSPPAGAEVDLSQLSPDKKGLSKLLMKNRRAGRKSVSLIHCIPKFSKVLPNKHMSEAQRALLTKIKSKHSENEQEDEDDQSDMREESGSELDIRVHHNSLPYHNFLPPELTIEPARSRPREQPECIERAQPEITIIPKYPQLLPSVTPSQQSLLSTMQMLVLRKEDYETLLPTNPVFSSYIFLPSLNLFVHPLVFPTQLLHLPAARGHLEPQSSSLSDIVRPERSPNTKQLVVTNTTSTTDGATFCTLKSFSN